MKRISCFSKILSLLCFTLCLIFITYHGKWEEYPDWLPNSLGILSGLPNSILLLITGILILKTGPQKYARILGFIFMILSLFWIIYVLSVVPEKNY
jgi:drug/metabolite transporter superfamily protein YnfA